MNKTILAAAILAVNFLASSARAEGEFRYMPEPAFNSIVNRTIELIEPQDAFAAIAACRVIDTPTFRQLALTEAVKALKPCLDGVSASYGVRVSVKQAAPAGLLVIETNGATIAAPVTRDLNFALNLRNGKLLGHPARISRAESLSQPAGVVQQALRRCLLPMVVRKIETSEYFIQHYGRCITGDAALKVSEIRPAAGHPMAVTLLSDGSTAEVQALNGAVTVNAGAGPVTVMVTAYPRTVFLP